MATLTMLENHEAKAKTAVLRAIDWFVPERLRTDTASLWKARIFTISHLLGPCLGVVILIYLYLADPRPTWPYWTLCVLASAFWLLPLAMKVTGNLWRVALFSVCDLTFVSVFGSYFYGGVSSPLLPWFLTALLLGFFYLGDSPILVLAIFSIHLIGFGAAWAIFGGFPNLIPVAALSTVGVVSVCAATLYTSMMAIYYASVMIQQSDMRREVDRHAITTRQARAAKERADRADHEKSVFLAKMSHHLRTPLNAIIGYSELLLEEAEPVEDDAWAKDLKRIHSAGQHLLALVTDVLDLSKIGSNDIYLTIRKFKLDELIDDVAATCRRLVERNGNVFVVQKDGVLGHAVSDDTRWRQIIINLLSNAGKFTHGGRVTLHVKRRISNLGDVIIITVRDTGIGISTENLAKLFRDFNQADASTSGKYGGTGLGLALSRQLCHQMGGEIDVTSEIGKGSSFVIRLPAADISSLSSEVRVLGSAA